MPKLYFNLSSNSGLNANLAPPEGQPLQIRTPNLGLVHRTLSSRPVELKKGKYLVTAETVSGLKIFKEVELGDADETVQLSPDADDEPASSESQFPGSASPIDYDRSESAISDYPVTNIIANLRPPSMEDVEVAIIPTFPDPAEPLLSPHALTRMAGYKQQN